MKWKVQFADRTSLCSLEADLRAAEERERRELERRYGTFVYWMVDRYAGLKVEIYANEHPPPHFHVSCAAGKASFRISDGTRLNGDLQSEARVIQKWHAKNKGKLIRVWNKSRPTDCPVGEYKE